MRIAYLCHYIFNEGIAASGVYKKILHQTQCWCRFGHEVAIFHISRKITEVPECIQPTWRVFRYTRFSLASRLHAWEMAARAILQWQPDVVYHRFDSYYPALTSLAREVPMVLEINTADLNEYRLGSPLRCLYNRLTRGLLLREVAGLVFVSGELPSLPYFSQYHKPHVVIGNGIQLESYNPLPPSHNTTPRLVFLGSTEQPWHGVDKILCLADRKSDWMFEIIGLKPDGRNRPNVVFYGALSRREYEPILVKADVAIGTLALHRKNMNEASPLKVREYLAYGLPVIIGYKDTDFPESVPFILELPNTEDNVMGTIGAIEAFVQEWLGKRVPREAVLHLDTMQKERIRLAFLREVARHFEKNCLC